MLLSAGLLGVGAFVVFLGLLVWKIRLLLDRPFQEAGRSYVGSVIVFPSGPLAETREWICCYEDGTVTVLEEL